MGNELKELYEEEGMSNAMKTLHYESLRPQMHTSEITNSGDINTLGIPAFPLDVVLAPPAPTVIVIVPLIY